jgi:hypothetical protein
MNNYGFSSTSRPKCLLGLSCLFLANLKNNDAIPLHSNISGLVRVSHAQLVQGVFEVALDFRIFISLKVS